MHKAIQHSTESHAHCKLIEAHQDPMLTANSSPFGPCICQLVQAPATHMNRLKLKLLRASLIIAELVREKEKLASIVKTLVSHLGTPRPHLEHSTPQGPTPHSIHTAHKEHTPHPTHLVPVTKGESESERSESSSRPPPSGRLSSGRQERGVQFDGPPLGEEGGNRTGRETPPFGDEVRQDVGDGDQRKECPGGCPHCVSGDQHDPFWAVVLYIHTAVVNSVCKCVGSATDSAPYPVPQSPQNNTEQCLKSAAETIWTCLCPCPPCGLRTASG